MPSLTRYQAPAEGWNQNRQRGLGLFFDQHRSKDFPDGRPWWCYTERPADGAHMPHPVGELIPHQWSAPWTPEAMYMQMSMGTLQTNRFRIMYERMIADYQQARDEYYQRAVAEAVQNSLPIPESAELLTHKLVMIVGRPPRSPRIPEAALAGDRWLLGFTTEPNEYLQRLLDYGSLKVGRPTELPIEQIINRTTMPGTDEPEQRRVPGKKQAEVA